MTPGEARVLAAACGLARRLPDATLERFCAALDGLPVAPSQGQIEAAVAILVDEEARGEARKVLQTWREKAAHLSPQTFAWMLRGAAFSDAWREEQQRVEVVWTGPSANSSDLRRTDAALIEVIDGARERLWLVTFAAYRVAPVMAALRRASARGVKIIFVGESSDESEALSSGGASTLRAHLPASVTFYIWPQEKRARDENGNAGTLHAKLAIADGKVALVSSANLSGHALRLNIEAGVLVRGAAASTLEAQLARLVNEGVFQPLP